MAIPLVIDTDMGVDDAVAIALALSSSRLDVRALVSVGGNVSLQQASWNIGRLLTGLGVTNWPALGRGLDQLDEQLSRAHHVFGEDGLGGVSHDGASRFDATAGGLSEVFEQALAGPEGELVVIAIGPLTNLSALLADRPAALKRVSRIIIMGGAVLCPGNVTPHAEFNFYRDPAAASAVLASGLPITVVPLDVTRQVAMDMSHTARLSRSGSRTGELLGRMIQYPLENHAEAGAGRFLVHDALAVGLLLWPELFMQARMGIEVVTSGPQAGRSKPVVLKDKKRQVSVVMSVNRDEFLEKMLELLCRDHFAV
jgi:inosine-uridine nucleoside N-ribohydrolase